MAIVAGLVLSLAFGLVCGAIYVLLQKIAKMEAMSGQVVERLTEVPDSKQINQVQEKLDEVGAQLQEVQKITPESIMEQLKVDLEDQMEKVMGGAPEQVITEDMSVSEKRKIAGAMGLDARRRKKLRGMFEDATQEMIAQSDPVTSMVVQRMPILGEYLSDNPDYLPLALEVGRPFIEKYLPMIVKHLPPNVQAEVNRTLALLKGKETPDQESPTTPPPRADQGRLLTGFD